MRSGYVHSETVINEAATRLGISNPEAFRLRFLKLIIDAEKKIATIGSVGWKYYLYEVGANDFLDGIRLLIPHDLIDSMCVLDESGCPINPCDYYIQGNYIRFCEVRTTSVIIKYRGVLLDIKGNPIIPYNHFEATTCYIIHMYNTTRYHSKNIARYMYVDSKMEWRDRLGEARGNDMFPDEIGIVEAGQALYNAKICRSGMACSKATTVKDIKSLIDQFNTVEVPVTNSPPIVIGDNLLNISNRSTHVFTIENFTTETTPAYFDPEFDAGEDVFIEGLPLDGQLLLNNVPVTPLQRIAKSDIDSGLFTYVSPDIDGEFIGDFKFYVSDIGSSTLSTDLGIMTIKSIALVIGARWQITSGKCDSDLTNALWQDIYTNGNAAPAIGVIIYSDQTLTIPFVGDTIYRVRNEALTVLNEIFIIDASGEVQNTAVCN